MRGGRLHCGGDGSGQLVAAGCICRCNCTNGRPHAHATRGPAFALPPAPGRPRLRAGGCDDAPDTSATWPDRRGTRCRHSRTGARGGTPAIRHGIILHCAVRYRPARQSRGTPQLAPLRNLYLVIRIRIHPPETTLPIAQYTIHDTL